MSLFSGRKCVLWPHAQTVDIYLNQRDNNYYSFDIDFSKEISEPQKVSLANFFQKNKIKECYLLLSDDLVVTRSFIYDSKITQIDSKEVTGLAKTFVPFEIEPDALKFNLIPLEDKTIIQAQIFDLKKITPIYENLSAVNLSAKSVETVSSACIKTISTFNQNEYFLVYPLSKNNFILVLSKNQSIYLTSVVKGPTLEIQKIVNYSNLYFSSPTTKIYFPSQSKAEIESTTKMETVSFDEKEIAIKLNYPSNLPLPVLGLFLSQTVSNPVIITKMNEKSPQTFSESSAPKRNLLPIIAVFIITASLASIFIWLILNRSGDGKIKTPKSSEITPTIAELPTSVPTAIPTAAEISKSLKLQVLNATEINGQAALLKEKLTKLGFTSVTVGNSTNTATANLIQTKASLSTSSAYFKDKLTGVFDAEITSDLKSTSTYDVVFTIGTDIRGQSLPASTVSPSPSVTKKPTPSPTLTE
ncbi:MAG: LytR C-terminal domain-containing protein [Candidatus Shapirobacteria bacterium]